MENWNHQKVDCRNQFDVLGQYTLYHTDLKIAGIHGHVHPLIPPKMVPTLVAITKSVKPEILGPLGPQTHKHQESHETRPARPWNPNRRNKHRKFMKFILPNMWCCHRSSLSGFMSFLFAFLGVALKKRCLLLLTSEQDPKNSKIHQGHRVVLFEMWANWHIGNKPAINKQFATNNLYSRFQTCNKRDLMAMCPFFFYNLWGRPGRGL
jgi:hypothetical protein